jgi:hypothetical protein
MPFARHVADLWSDRRGRAAVATEKDSTQVLTDDPGKFGQPNVAAPGNSDFAQLPLNIVEIDGWNRGLRQSHFRTSRRSTALAFKIIHTKGPPNVALP